MIVPASSAVWYEGGAASIREVVSETDALRDVDIWRGVRGAGNPDSVLAFVNPVGVSGRCTFVLVCETPRASKHSYELG